MEGMRFLRYVRSFLPGRVRLRHPALQREAVAAQARECMLAVPGVRSVDINTLSGSVLLCYESGHIGRDRLVDMGVALATWLDAVQDGQALPPPELQGAR